MVKTIDMQEMRYLNLFEQITRVRTRFCFKYNECDVLKAFINAGKAVFQVEYNMDTSQFCPKANSMNFNSMKKKLI